MMEHVHNKKSFEAEARYLEAAQSENLLVKSRVNVTRNVVESYESKNGSSVSCAGKDFALSVEALAKTAYSAAQSKRILETLDPQAVLQEFGEGNGRHKVEYQRRDISGNVTWVCTVAKSYCDPDSGDVVLFVYTYDIDAEKTMRVIVDKIVDIDYELLGLISTETKMLHCVCHSVFEQDMHYGRDVRYPEGMAEFVDRYVADEKAEAKIGLGFETIIDSLKQSETYSCAFTLHRNGNRSRKKWQFAYLDENRSSVILVRSDISQLFEQQEQQKEALRDALALAERANSEKSAFLSRMSHEIRTPMNVIIGMSSLAAEHVDEPEQVANYLSKIGISARFLLSLINDILDMSAIESGKISVKNKEFPFQEFLEGINAIAYEMASSKGVDFDCVLASPTDGRYIGDAMKLQQIIVNLLTNAIKFTPERGRVELIVDQSWTNHKRAHLRFTVTDTGVGIKEEFLPRLFDAFEQGHTGNTAPYGGTGLGLAIAKSLATMMGGTISASSLEGEGSKFTLDVTLDRYEEKTQASELRANVTLDNLSVLVVDDDPSICEHTKTLLNEMGMRSEGVGSGPIAVQLVQERQSCNESFDLILIDWEMPGMDGIETARRIRNIAGPDTTTIIITAYDWAGIEKEAKQAGVDLLISKPLFKTSLHSALETALTRDAPRKEEPSAAERFDLEGKRVLLVEDHDLNVEVASYLLESKGIEVDTAENGLIAIEKFAQAPCHHYDAILMDIRMPIMDGLTAARSIRQMQKETATTVPIIALSANAFDEDIGKSLAAGMDAHLGKPIEAAELYRLLSELTNKKG